jgi:predicted DsbA family dithiol-disulfide isomerase
MPVRARNTPQPKNDAAEGTFWSQSMPLYIGVLLLILGLIAGFGLRAAFFEAPVIIDPDQNTPSELPALQIQVYLPSDCNGCVQKTIPELILEKRGIAYERTVADTRDPAVIARLKQLGAASLPITVMDTIELQRRDQQLFDTISAYGDNRNGQLVLEDRRVYRQTLLAGSPLILQYLDNPSAACTVTAKAQVLDFDDPLCRDCFASHGQVDRLLENFGPDIDYQYRTYLRAGQGDDGESAANAILCAADQNNFLAYKDRLGQQWYERGLPVWENAQQYTIAQDTNTKDLNAFRACIDTNRHYAQVDRNTSVDAALAARFAITRQPAFVIDCQYVVFNPQSISAVLCGIHPELAGCKDR